MSYIYIAGKYTSKERLREVRDRVTAYGYTVKSSWLDETLKESFDNSSMPPPFYEDVATEPQMLANAHMDLDEVMGADAIWLDEIDDSLTGGREVELGAIIGFKLGTHQGIPAIVIIGGKRNIFHHLCSAQFDSWEDFYLEMERLNKELDVYVGAPK